MRNPGNLCLFAFAALLSTAARADGLVVDKVYHPYVDALEREIEYRVLAQDEHQDFATPAQLHQISFGAAIGSRVFAELYAKGAKSRAGDFGLAAWEAEMKWQLTEQGEYGADAGLLFEYENEQDNDVQEFSVALLLEKEWGNWSGVANLHLINEWGDDIDPEVESILAGQLRYRWKQTLEPGIEVYAGQGTRGVGPVLQGTINTDVRHNLHWEAGLIIGLNSSAADRTWRLLLEYEF